MGATVFLFLALPFVVVVVVSWIAVLRDRQSAAESRGIRVVGREGGCGDGDLLWRRYRTISTFRVPVLVEEERLDLEEAA